MTARTGEIRKRLEAKDPRYFEHPDDADLKYRLARHEKLEGLLKRAGDEGNHHTQCNYACPAGCDCGWLAVERAIDAALGEP